MDQLQRALTPKVVELVRLGAESSQGQLASRRSLAATVRAALHAYMLFILIVAAPTLGSALYYFGFASDQYESEIQFVVRSPVGGASSFLSNFVQSSSIARSSDDAYVVQDFILSRDAMNYLVEKAALLDAFQRSDVDFLSRFPPPWRSASEENLFKYYLKFVTVDYDHDTGLMALKVRAFRPPDAQRLANGLVERAEAFINGLNRRASADAIEAGTEEVKIAEARAHAALDELTAFRNRVKIIDPAQAAAGSVNAIAALSLAMAENNATLTRVEKETPDGPQIAALKHKIDSLQEQIAIESRKLAGGGDSLAPLVVEYESLMLNQTFAEKAFLSALATRETARLDAIKQRVFLEPVTSATAPDYPVSPRRWLMVLGTLAITFMVWRISRTLIADTVEHGAR